MTLKTEILSSFETVDRRVEKFLDRTINAISEQKINITDYTKMILTMLVTQLILHFKAYDEVFKNNGTVTAEDSYKRASKAPAISVMQQTHDKILQLFDKITLSPLASAKVKKLNSNSDEQSAQEYLDALIK